MPYKAACAGLAAAALLVVLYSAAGGWVTLGRSALLPGASVPALPLAPAPRAWWRSTAAADEAAAGAGAAAAAAVAAEAEAHRVRGLPGWGRLRDLRLYSGYVNVSSARSLFYLFVEAERPAADTPLVLWLTGRGAGLFCFALQRLAWAGGRVNKRRGSTGAGAVRGAALGVAGRRGQPRCAPLARRSWGRRAYSPPLRCRLLATSPTPRSGPGCSSVGTAFIGEHGPLYPRPCGKRRRGGGGGGGGGAACGLQARAGRAGRAGPSAVRVGTGAKHAAAPELPPGLLSLPAPCPPTAAQLALVPPLRITLCMLIQLPPCMPTLPCARPAPPRSPTRTRTTASPTCSTWTPPPSQASPSPPTRVRPSVGHCSCRIHSFMTE